MIYFSYPFYTSEVTVCWQAKQDAGLAVAGSCAVPGNRGSMLEATRTPGNFLRWGLVVLTW